MLQDVEQFYFGSYMAHFAEPAFASALAAIPFTFSWDGEATAALLRQWVHACVTGYASFWVTSGVGGLQRFSGCVLRRGWAAQGYSSVGALIGLRRI
jgi:hypothetical protein